MAPSLFRRNKLLYLRAKEKSSYFIVVCRGRKRKHSSNFCYKLFFSFDSRAKPSRATNINHKYNCKLSLLFKNFYKRSIQSSCYIPVHIPYIVSKLILPNFTKSHPPTFKCRVIFTSKNLCR